jgi:hypothetical protein
MVEQLHAPRAVVSEPLRAINIEFVLECESPHVHAVAKSILHFRTGLLQRTRIHCQEGIWWHIDPCNISLAIVSRCLEGQVPFSVVMGLFAQSLELFVRVELVKYGI